MSGFLFDLNDEPPAQAARLAPRLKRLAERGVYLGASSWKYEGWLGTIYNPDRYQSRGKFSSRKFEAECLAEYAEVFPTVCGDFSFYQFPTDEYWAGLFDAVPEGFLFGLKVPEDVTVARWPSHARYGVRAGLANDDFLNSDMFRRLFLTRLEPHRGRVACLILEFGTFAKSTFPTPGDFYGALAPFLDELPGGFRFAIEVRNAEYLSPAYFELLAAHNVAHVFNSWTRMPDLSAQVRIPDAFSADFTVARAVLPRGTGYEAAHTKFEPFDRLVVLNESARQGLRELADRAIETRNPAFLFVNNSLEGNSPGTIEAVAGAIRIE